MAEAQATYQLLILVLIVVSDISNLKYVEQTSLIYYILCCKFSSKVQIVCFPVRGSCHVQ